MPVRLRAAEKEVAHLRVNFVTEPCQNSTSYFLQTLHQPIPAELSFGPRSMNVKRQVGGTIISLEEGRSWPRHRLEHDWDCRSPEKHLE